MNDKWDDDGYRRGEFGKSSAGETKPGDEELSKVQSLELELERLKAQQGSLTQKNNLPPPKGVVQSVNTNVYESNARMIALVEKQLNHERKISMDEPGIEKDDIDPSDRD